MQLFKVLVRPEFKPQNPGKESVHSFKSKLNAEIYILSLEGSRYSASRLNFDNEFHRDEVLAEAKRHAKLLSEANRLQKQAMDRTSANFANPNWNPCEVCGKRHPNYECCEKCNYNRHICHFCGDDLGHAEVSMCYMMEGLGE